MQSQREGKKSKRATELVRRQSRGRKRGSEDKRTGGRGWGAARVGERTVFVALEDVDLLHPSAPAPFHVGVQVRSRHEALLHAGVHPDLSRSSTATLQ
eukprot:1458979-Rhodomonas_salina.1